MITNPLQQQQTSLRDVDFNYHFQHYLKLFWKWKWYILFAGPIAGAIALFAVLRFGLLKYPPLPATVYIGIDEQKGKIYDDIAGGGQNKERILLNRSFLQSVVQKLSLQMVISGYSRNELFDSLYIDSTAPVGSFRFVIDRENRNNYKILFSNSSLKIKNKVVESGNLSALKNLSFSGINACFSDAFLKEPHDFSFSILPIRYAIDLILNKLKVTSPNVREQMFYFSVTLEGSDYQLLAQTLNNMADLFIQDNVSIQRRQLKETIVELEKQLAAAELQQSQSKSELKKFLASNPSAGLTQSTQQTMTELIQLESGSYESNNQIEELKNLKAKFNVASKEEQPQVINEMIVFLQTHGSLAAPSLQANLAQYTQEKLVAQQNYAKTHPIFAEIEGKFAALNARTLQAVDSYIAQSRKTLTDKNYSIQKITSRLQGLPSQELQLAELQKRQDIDSDIYSKLLAKYNEAKVAESVRGTDVFIMEYAVPPIAPSRLLQYAKSFGIILFSIIFVAFCPAAGLDLIDKTARSEQQLTRMLNYKFLETIPLIKMPKQKDPYSVESQSNINMNEILVNQPGIQPPSAVELFRSLTTKILLDFYDVQDRSFAVTSFEMDEGKSTIAANIAIALAGHGVKTVLIDCDLRRGVAHKILSIKKIPGLTDYLISASINNQLKAPPVPLPLQSTSISNLWIIPAGTVDDNPQRLLRSPALAALKQQLLNESYFVIFDTPPVAVAADSAILSSITSKYVLVIRAGRTNVIKLRKILVKDYPMIDKKILGTVLNMGENTVPTRYYSYYYNGKRRHPRSDA